MPFVLVDVMIDTPEGHVHDAYPPGLMGFSCFLHATSDLVSHSEYENWFPYYRHPNCWERHGEIDMFKTCGVSYSVASRSIRSIKRRKEWEPLIDPRVTVHVMD